MSEDIITKSTNGVLHIILNRPEKRNALTRDMYERISQSLESGDDDPNVRVIMLYGNGKSFCAGNDVKDFQDKDWGSEMDSLNISRTIPRVKKPLIAAVHGYATGVGATMLLHFDLVYASNGCRFQYPFVNLGLVPEFGSTTNLPFLVGYQRAAELFFFGDWFTAEDALNLGLVNKVFPEDTLVAEVTSLAESLALKPPEALRNTKMLMKRFYSEVFGKYKPEEWEVFKRMQKSPEAQEAFQAFLERRKPDFSRFS
jgi:enoyl-CoA hydratase/carnithine racemase